MAAAPARTFAPMGLHIGQEIFQRWEKSGLPKNEFADRIRVHRNTVKSVFEAVSVDTMQLDLIGRVLGFNFHRLLADKFDQDNPTLSLAEPRVGYNTAPARAPMRVIFEIDPQDANARRIAGEMAEKLGGSVSDAPRPDPEKG